MTISRENEKKITKFDQLAHGKVYETQDPARDAGKTMFVLAAVDTSSGRTMAINLETGRVVDMTRILDSEFFECKSAVLLPYGNLG